MNRKGLYYGLAYCALAIAFKLYIVLGGFSLSHFGWHYSNVIAVFAIIPFYMLAIRSVRDKDMGGLITGREALRIALTVFATGAIVMSLYNYLEFEFSGKALAIEYYNGPDFMNFLTKQPKINPADYDRIIAEQIKGAETASFKATTGKLFSYMLIGLSSAVIVSLLMRKKISQQV
jgi:hypothetical protein